jgi:delta24-sterol reductase
VNVEGLDRILEIDRESTTATVEGQVTLGQLCRATLAQGLMPKVVPEFETFTISGLVSGLGIETSSHRHGLFPSSFVGLEVVLGNGEVVQADRRNHLDLLQSLPGSYGTLGVVTRATLELSLAKPFIRSRYYHFPSCKAYVAAFADALADHDFVEGFVLGRSSYVLVTGDYSDSVAGLDVFEAMKAGNPWYYQHAETRARARQDDLIPSYQYMFRHQRGLFWIAGVVADLKIFTRTRWGRALVDRQAEARVRATGFRANMPVELIERCVVNQDMGMRMSRLAEGIEYVQKHLGVYPLWNCAAGPGGLDLPFALPPRRYERKEMIVDIGIYGEPTVRHFRNLDAIAALQKFADAPSLWGVCYLTAEELRETYDFGAYEAAQRKYHAIEAFVPLTEKMRFMRRSGAKEGPIPLWRLLRLWYDFQARAA